MATDSSNKEEKVLAEAVEQGEISKALCSEPRNQYPLVHLTESDHLEVLDPSIMADRETSLQVTAWVRANYVLEREHNVPRRNMYEHYKAYCTANELQPVNSATFGKLLRVVFPDLKTRRLGVRGQSKYHYCGIRVRNEDEVIIHQPDINTRRSSSPKQELIPDSHPSRTYRVQNPPLGIPNFIVPSIPAYRFNQEIENSQIITFTSMYERHCREIFDMISSCQAERVRGIMHSFYQDMSPTLKRLVHNIPELTEAIWRWDSSLYDAMLDTFLPTIHHPLSTDMTRTLRTYTRELIGYLESCLISFPETLYQKKADVARIFSAKLRRQLSLNFAAQNASSVLATHPHLTYMRQDWNNFDFDSILDQTLWVCDCDTEEIRSTFRDIYALLNNHPSIEHWMHWMSTIVDKYLRQYTPSTPNEALQYVARSKQLLLKWNFYATLIMKDLTLQQARSFGSFHNLRLFLDDYLLYLIEEGISHVNYTLMDQRQQPQQDYYSTNHINATSVTVSGSSNGGNGVTVPVPTVTTAAFESQEPQE